MACFLPLEDIYLLRPLLLFDSGFYFHLPCSIFFIIQGGSRAGSDPASFGEINMLSFLPVTVVVAVVVFGFVLLLFRFDRNLHVMKV